MGSLPKKYERLTRVARMYYEENKTQNEISREINVSRPMVSKLIAEARELGIVSISIGDPVDGGSELGKALRARFGLKAAAVIADREEDVPETNARLAKAILEIIKHAAGRERNIGIGWGRMVQSVCETNTQPIRSAFSKVIPLTGGKSSARIYEHCNGMSFDLALKIGASAEPIFLPAEICSEAEHAAIKTLAGYSAAQRLWNDLDSLLIEIEEPQNGEAGSFLGYSFDENGKFLPDNQTRFCASISQIRKAQNAMAVADAQLPAAILLSALKTETFTHAVMTEKTANELLSS